MQYCQFFFCLNTIHRLADLSHGVQHAYLLRTPTRPCFALNSNKKEKRRGAACTSGEKLERQQSCGLTQLLPTLTADLETVTLDINGRQVVDATNRVEPAHIASFSVLPTLGAHAHELTGRARKITPRTLGSVLEG